MVERNIGNSIEETEGKDGLLAELHEEEEVKLQMDKIRTFTVDEGWLKLPVGVTTAENSEQIVLEAEHPIEGELRFYIEKPKRGWSNDEKLPKMLKWYGYPNSTDPFALQSELIHIKHSEKSGEWRLVKPPLKPSSRKEKWKWAAGDFLSSSASVLYGGIKRTWGVSRGAFKALIAMILFGLGSGLNSGFALGYSIGPAFGLAMISGVLAMFIGISTIPSPEATK